VLASYTVLYLYVANYLSSSRGFFNIAGSPLERSSVSCGRQHTAGGYHRKMWEPVVVSDEEARALSLAISR
jgi:hypothetical protein